MNLSTVLKSADKPLNFEQDVKGSRCIMYRLNELNLFLGNNQKEIVSFTVNPIQHDEYSFIFYEEENELGLLYSCFGVKHLEKLKEILKKEVSYDEFEALKRDKEFVKEYKRKFYKELPLEKSYIDLLSSVCAIDFNRDENKWLGLDGWSVNCRSYNQEKELHLWCCVGSTYFEPIVTLVNNTMRLVGIDDEYSFRIIH